MNIYYWFQDQFLVSYRIAQYRLRSARRLAASLSKNSTNAITIQNQTNFTFFTPNFHQTRINNFGTITSKTIDIHLPASPLDDKIFKKLKSMLMDFEIFTFYQFKKIELIKNFYKSVVKKLHF